MFKNEESASCNIAASTICIGFRLKPEACLEIKPLWVPHRCEHFSFFNNATNYRSWDLMLLFIFIYSM